MTLFARFLRPHPSRDDTNPNINEGSDDHTVRHFHLRRRQPLLRATGSVDPSPSRPVPQPAAVREARERPHQARRRRQDQRVHPQPDVRRRRPPGRPGGVLPQGQPGREEPPRAVRRADQVAARVPRTGVTARADERAGHRPHADVPDAGQRHRGADEARSRTSSTPRSTASTSGCTRPGSSTTRTASSPRR